MTSKKVNDSKIRACARFSIVYYIISFFICQGGTPQLKKERKRLPLGSRFSASGLVVRLLALQLRLCLFFLFLFALEGVLCLLVHLLKDGKRFFILGEKPPQKADCNGNGDKLFGCEWKPKKAKIYTPHSKHPTDIIKRTNTNKNIAPAVCNHPRQSKAQNEARIEEKLDYFFDRFFQLFFHLITIPICRMLITLIIPQDIPNVNRMTRFFANKKRHIAKKARCRFDFLKVKDCRWHRF